MISWRRKPGFAASVLAFAAVTACLAPAGAASASVDLPPGISNGACGNTRADFGLAPYWSRRLASDLDPVDLPDPDCVRGGRAGDVTVLWLQSEPGFLGTLLSAFEEARWYFIHTSSDSFSFEDDYGTVVSASYVRYGYADSASYVRYGYADSSEPYVALVYVPAARR
jgi:hypothetical protein